MIVHNVAECRGAGRPGTLTIVPQHGRTSKNGSFFTHAVARIMQIRSATKQL